MIFQLLNSVFIDQNSTTNGGVLFIKCKDLKVYCCIFDSNYCENHGGCLYVTDSNVDISKTSFSKCYVRNRKDGNLGNAIFISKNKALFSYISTNLCGPDSTRSSDSSIALESCFTKLSFYNASNNNGYMGASAIRNYNCVDGSIVEYVQDYNSLDLIAIESCGQKYNVSKSNFIDFSGDRRYMYYGTSSDLILFSQCVFWNCVLTAFSYSSAQYSFENCLTNSISALTITSSFAWNSIVFNVVCPKTRLARSCRCKRDRSFGIYFYILLMWTENAN